MPKIGYGSATLTRHVCPDGFKKFVVHNVKVSNFSQYLLFCFFALSIILLSKTHLNLFLNFNLCNKLKENKLVPFCLFNPYTQ